MKFLKQLSWETLPVYFFIFTFWFKNGFVDKVMGVLLGMIYEPESKTFQGMPFPYKGDTWLPWKEYIVGNWDKSRLAHVIFSPVYDVLFPVLVVMQCLPFVLILISLFKGEAMRDKNRPMLFAAAVASLFITSCMAVTQTLAGASDGQYLWQLLGFSMIAILYVKKFNRA